MATASVHTKPTVASVAGAVVGLAILAVTYLKSGTLPSSVEVAGVVSGSGVSFGSVGLFVAHYVAWLKANGPTIEADARKFQAALDSIPGADAVEASIVAKVKAEVERAVPAVDVDQVAELVKAKIVSDAVSPADRVAASLAASTPTVPTPVAVPNT